MLFCIYRIEIGDRKSTVIYRIYTTLNIYSFQFIFFLSFIHLLSIQHLL